MKLKLGSATPFEKINDYIEEEYFKTTICNIYFDNDSNDLIINSLEKPIYKTKVRVRSYDVPKKVIV